MSPSKTRSRRWTAFTLIELLVVIAIIGILVALLLPAIQAAREAGRRSACSNNLKQIGLALQEYHDVNLTFPSAAYLYRPTSPGQFGAFHHTWLTSILPFMEQKPLHDNTNFDRIGFPNTQAWGQPIVGTQLKVLMCPSDGNFTKPSETHGIAFTNYAGTEGYHWWGEAVLWMQPSPPWNDIVIDPVPWDPTGQWGYADFAGLFAPTKTRTMGHIKDGTANTIAVAESDSLGYKWGGGWGPGGTGLRRTGAGESVFRTAFLWTPIHGWTANDGNAAQPPVQKADDSGPHQPGQWFRSGPHTHSPTYITAWHFNTEWPGTGGVHTGKILLTARCDGSVGTYNEAMSWGVWQMVNGVQDGGVLVKQEDQ